MKTTNISIYNYIDYCEYLSIWFEYQKNNRYGFSYRSFARLAHIESHNYLQRVISRQRKLSEKYLPNIIAALKLDESESEYLSTLVAIERCRDDQKREKLTTKLIGIRTKQSSGKLTQPMLHYLSHWYYPVVRELIIIHQTIDPQKLSLLIKPSVSIKKLLETIHFLLENNYITEKDNRFIHRSPILTTGDEVISNIVNHFHRENLTLSAEDLTNSPLEDRDISSLVLALSEDSFIKIKKEIQQFRKKLLHISEENQDADRVYHLGFQLLPRSKFTKKAAK